MLPLEGGEKMCVCVTGKDKRREGHKKSKAHTFGLPTCSIPYNNVGSIATPKHMYALTCAKPIRSECILIPNMSLLPDASSSLEHALLSSLRSGLTNFGDAQNDHIEVLTHPLILPFEGHLDQLKRMLITLFHF